MKTGGPLDRNTPLSRRTPLTARTPLRASQPLGRIIQLRPAGASARRQASFYAQCRAVVMKRAGCDPNDYGKCEVCGASAHLDPHHVFGRSLGIRGGHRWLSVPEMMLGICRKCHHGWHDETLFDVKMKDHWRFVCLHKLALRHGVVVPSYEGDVSMSMLAAARYVASELVARGIEATP